MKCHDQRAALRTWLLGELPDERVEALLAHVRECETCRAAHDAHVRGERALVAGPGAERLDVPSPWEVERGLARLRAAGVWGEATSPAPALARVLPWRSRTARRVAWVALAPLAAAALVVLAVYPRGPGPLPGYALTLTGGEQELRGTDPSAGRTRPRFGPDARVRLALHPATPVAGPMEVHVFLVAGGKARAIDARASVDAGTVLIEGDARTLLRVPPGEWDLVVALGRPGQVPDTPAALEQSLGAGAMEAPGWRLFREPVEVVGAE
jgi:hypothetical protein